MQGLVLSAPAQVSALLSRIDELGIRLTITNVSDSEVSLLFDSAMRTYRVLAYDSSGNQVPSHSWAPLVKSSTGLLGLAVGASRCETIRVSRFAKFERAGTYRLAVIRTLRGGSILSSNLIELTVTE